MAVAMVAEGASVEEVAAVAAMVEVGGEMAMAEEAEMAKEGSVCQPHWVGLAVVAQLAVGVAAEGAEAAEMAVGTHNLDRPPAVAP